LGDIVCISHLRWDFVWQRPQHLLASLSKYGRVLFVEEPVTRPGLIEPYLEVLPGHSAEDVTIVRLIQPTLKPGWIGHGNPLTQATYTRLLREFLYEEGFSRPVLWLYTPLGLDFIETIPHSLLVYDVLESLATSTETAPGMAEKEEKVLRQADLVLARCTSLYEEKKPFNARTHLLAGGVEAEYFAPAANPAQFPQPRELVGLKRPIIGFYGVIDDRMDLALLSFIAQARPDWSLLVVGPISRIRQEDLPVAPNIFYPGMKGYEELPVYLAFFNVALIPFALNEATHYLSPSKTLEYMAAHKPVVSTPLQDVLALYSPLVRVGRTPAEFVAQIEEALRESPEERRAGEDRLIALYTWESLAEKVRGLLEDSLETSGGQGE
jgi:UDP-galactopyranose mutase